jgi:drug/metabolite transporter (DMT)-like permease
MTKVIIVLLAALVLEAMGVVLLSRGLREIGEVRELKAGEILAMIKRGASNPSIMCGILLEAVFFGALLYLLSQRDVSLIWPLTSLGFVITALAARWILHEQVSWVRWSGVMLIVVGAGLVSYSEWVKAKRPEVPRHSPTHVAERF